MDLADWLCENKIEKIEKAAEAYAKTQEGK
jgi:hypothetical protein